MSLDGRIAAAGGKPVRLSNEEDMRRVHRLRDASDAILVGVGTVLRDDPGLLVKTRYVPSPRPRAPLRVVLDTNLRTPPTARVMDGATAPTLLCVGPGKAPAPLPANVAAQEFPLDEAGRPRLDAVLEALAQRGVRQVMVEGGSHVLASFVGARLFDEFTVFVAPRTLGHGPPLLAVAGEDALVRFLHAEPLGDGLLLSLAPG